mmetsp:Transcript_24790/g.49323  ORF Transcript_24790/g.49323 Transcript_24790/m.49323 type:complete len:205 (+) Transcript_24790:594-1208(+)
MPVCSLPQFLGEHTTPPPVLTTHRTYAWTLSSTCDSTSLKPSSPSAAKISGMLMPVALSITWSVSRKLYDPMRLATTDPTALLPHPIMPTKYRLDPCRRGPSRRAASPTAPSFSFSNGLSTPSRSATSSGSSHSKPPACRGGRERPVVRGAVWWCAGAKAVRETEGAKADTGRDVDERRSAPAAAKSDVRIVEEAMVAWGCECT